MHKRFEKYLRQSGAITKHSYRTGCRISIQEKHLKQSLYNAWCAGRRYGKMYEHDSYCRTKQDALISIVGRSLKQAVTDRIDEAWLELYPLAEEAVDESESS